MGLSGSIPTVPTKQSKICGVDFGVQTLETNLCSKAIKIINLVNAFHERVYFSFWCGLLSSSSMFVDIFLFLNVFVVYCSESGV